MIGGCGQVAGLVVGRPEGSGPGPNDNVYSVVRGWRSARRIGLEAARKASELHRYVKSGGRIGPAQRDNPGKARGIGPSRPRPDKSCSGNRAVDA
jgi:hypothetical protein